MALPPVFRTINMQWKVSTLNHIPHTRPHNLYVKHGLSKVIDYPDLPKYIKITQPQFDEAKAHLYGAIQASTRKSNTVKNFLNKHRDER